jgi:hypothetical protein
MRAMAASTAFAYSRACRNATGRRLVTAIQRGRLVLPTSALTRMTSVPSVAPPSSWARVLPQKPRPENVFGGAAKRLEKLRRDDCPTTSGEFEV